MEPDNFRIFQLFLFLCRSVRSDPAYFIRFNLLDKSLNFVNLSLDQI